MLRGFSFWGNKKQNAWKFHVIPLRMITLQSTKPNRRWWGYRGTRWAAQIPLVRMWINPLLWNSVWKPLKKLKAKLLLQLIHFWVSSPRDQSVLYKSTHTYVYWSHSRWIRESVQMPPINKWYIIQSRVFFHKESENLSLESTFVPAWVETRGQRTACRTQFSPSTMGVLGIELRSSDLAASALTCQTISLTRMLSFIGKMDGAGDPYVKWNKYPMSSLICRI